MGHSEHDAAGDEATAAGRSGTYRARRARGEYREALATEAATTLALKTLFHCTISQIKCENQVRNARGETVVYERETMVWALKVRKTHG